MHRALGIDLGTTNSVMAYIRRGEPQILANRDNTDLTPSVVGRGKRGELLIGKTAKARAILDYGNTIASVKRFMGRKFSDPQVQHALETVNYRITEGADSDIRIWLGEHDYSPIEVSALILRRLKEDAEARVGEPFGRAVITVPAYFGERQVAATREAGRMAGLQVLRIINEPTAAALAFGINREQTDENKLLLVYDLGGGTFDISILMLVQGTFAVLGIEGDNFLGGDDFDTRIVDHILAEIRSQHGVDLSRDLRTRSMLRSKAEEVKIALSNQLEVDITLPALGSEAIDLEMLMLRRDFEKMIEDRIDYTLELTYKAIREAHLTPQQIDQVLLVGGSTAIPLVEEKLCTEFGRDKIRKDVNPMQCVALGAAIQTALVADVECTSCRAHNPLAQDVCQSCGESLGGMAMVVCGACFGLTPAAEKQCRKCGQVFGAETEPPTAKSAPAGTVAPAAAAAPASKPASTPRLRCPQCGKPYTPGETTCSICQAPLNEPDGLKCPKCHKVNRAGVEACIHCGAELSVIDITAKDLGIELTDGRMAVLIPKGTNFPTLDPLRREFYTAVAGQRLLEVPIYEGAQAMARQNDLCGIVTMRLPEGLPRGTPVAIGFGLDQNRTITVDVKLRTALGQAKTVRLQRTRDPEELRKIETQREQLKQFVDKWKKQEELTEEELRSLDETLAQLDDALNEDPMSRRRPLESMLAEAEQVREIARAARGMDAFVHAILFAGGRYLAVEERATLEQLGIDIEQARARADWTAAQAIVARAREQTDRLPFPILLIVHARILANQNKLSPSLTHQVLGALRKLDEGLEAGSKERFDLAFDELDQLWPTILAEVSALGETLPTLSGVTDRM